MALKYYETMKWNYSVSAWNEVLVCGKSGRKAVKWTPMLTLFVRVTSSSESLTVGHFTLDNIYVYYRCRDSCYPSE